MEPPESAYDVPVLEEWVWSKTAPIAETGYKATAAAHAPASLTRTRECLIMFVLMWDQFGNKSEKVVDCLSH